VKRAFGKFAESPRACSTSWKLANEFRNLWRSPGRHRFRLDIPVPRRHRPRVGGATIGQLMAIVAEHCCFSRFRSVACSDPEQRESQELPC
jgi:hypothetical protein